MRELTDEQLVAVERRAEPLLLAAGAGSGKTSVLVERFVRAVRDDGIAPARIMAITFTDRAAGELRLRVRERLLELGEREAARDTESAFVSTFHGFCARLLRGHALAAGLDPQFAILDDAFAGRLRERAFAAALGDLLGDGSSEDAVDVVAAYGADRLRAMITGVYQELRSRGLRRPALPDAGARVRDGHPADVEAERVCRVIGELLSAFAGRYDELKQAQGALDFDDLELQARDLLKANENVRRSFSERFELMMVDEFQDTNPRQLEILEQIQRENLFTVGDEEQAIYGFRHADVRLFRTRRAELDERGGSLALTRNFRSRPPILDVVNVVFEERFGDGHTALVAAREPGERAEPLVELLLSATKGWPGGEAAEDGVPEHWRRAEAQALAVRVAELIGAGEFRAGDVAVLLRSANDLDIYEDALRREGLRTLATVGAYWERLEVGDVLSYLRALANPSDELALYGTLACPLVRVSRDGLALLAECAHASGRGVWEIVAGIVGESGGRENPDGTESPAADVEPDVAEGPGGAGDSPGGEDPGGGGDAEPLTRLSPGDRLALEGFAVRFAAERRMASRRTIAALIDRAIGQSGYRELLLSLEWGERRLANVHKLIRLARRFEETDGRDLRGFLDHVAYRQASRAGAEPDAPASGRPLDAVQLMTVHAAKGLEFPVVCVADLGRGRNLSTSELLVDGDRIGLRLVYLDGREAVTTLDFDELSAESRKRGAEEEERIIYVAMTRARERLLLSGAVAFEKWPQGDRAPAIAWLGPALSPELSDILAASGDGIIDLPVGRDARATVRLRVNTHEAARARAGDGVPPEGAGGERPGPAGQLRLDLPMEPPAGAPAAEPPAGAPADEPPVAAPAAERPVAAPAVEPPVTEPAVGPLSYTALTELERCGYRYYLERVLQLGEDRARAQPGGGGGRGGDELAARTRGILIHRLLEGVDFRGRHELGPGDVERVAAELGVRVAAGEREEVAAMVHAVSRAAATGFEPALRVAAALSVHREAPFALSLGADRPLLTGVIDLLAREAGGSVLVLDYKSDRLDDGQELEELTEREYGLQRALYALALLRDGAAAVDIVHWYLRRPRESVTARYLAGELAGLEERVGERIDSALGDPFAVSPNPHRGLCLTCPGRARLCSWSDAETLREPAGA